MQLPENTHPTLRGTRLVLGSLALATLAACANFSGIDPTAKPLDASSLGLKNLNATQDAERTATDSDWWLGFGDAQLNALVQTALQSNPGLKVAQARLSRALANSSTVAAVDGPQVNGALDLTRQLYSANSIYPAPFGGSVRDSGTLQATASWELDFFGKNQAALDASIGQIRATQADTRAARGLLAANVSRSYFQLVRLQAQLELAQRTLALREQTQGLVRDRVSNGLDTQLELQQSASALPDARLQIEMLNEQKALTLNALAALTAQPVSALKLELPALDTVSGVSVAQSMPLDLLGRRSDIAAARWRVEAALKDVAASKAQFYPNINLVAFAGFSSIGFDKLLKSDSEQWGVGPAIRLPLFEGGRLRANLRGKTADLDAAIESYNAQVLDAVHEVADRITSAQAVRRQQAEQATAQSATESAYAIAQQRYKAGLSNYLNVLSAEAPLLAQRRQRVDLAARALDAQVQILHAIGGDLPAAAAQ
ncbi:RND transporter [Rhodoferax lacus]|uniref:RND transporter n=1 Tax=Rhodoferax lacus TaxID=2184758 RepID=A0A3E1RIU8_9BURK|nr:efflux transporter outer membrane subunit [Rhodoferax lacus]RFO98922.1 RND transporter [Rhodoferax lacus]